MKSLTLFFILVTSLAFSQNCTFNYYNKKGGHYLFSTYYQSDMRTKMEGVCEQSMNGQLYEKRIFKDGHLIEEELNYADNIRKMAKSNKIGYFIIIVRDAAVKRQWSFFRTGNCGL